VIFGIFWLLGYQFSPRIAGVGGAPQPGRPV
jgi:TnpA family transposase